MTFYGINFHIIVFTSPKFFFLAIRYSSVITEDISSIILDKAILDWKFYMVLNFSTLGIVSKFRSQYQANLSELIDFYFP